MFNSSFSVNGYEVVNINNLNYMQFKIMVTKAVGRESGGTVMLSDVKTVKQQSSSLCISAIIILSLILSWPALNIRKKIKSLVIAIPLIIIIESLAFPLNLSFKIESVYTDNNFMKLFYNIYGDFISSGGKQFLALLAFLLILSSKYIKQPIGINPSVRRNAPCPCGSGKKFKYCCLRK